MMSSGDESATMTIDFADLSSDIEIAAPDPATVISSARADALMEGRYVDALGVSETDEIMLATTRGERSKDEIIGELVHSGGVIGVAPEAALTMTDELTRREMLETVRAGMVREGVDPAAADDMTDRQLPDLIDGYLDSISEGQPDEDMDEFAGCLP